jgi:biopolymer transport protein ExbD
MFQIERYQEAAVITLMAQGNRQMYLGTQACTMVELDQLLGKTIDKGVAPNAVVVIKADRMVSSESLRQVAEVCLRKGLKVVLAGGGRRTSLQEASQ